MAEKKYQIFISSTFKDLSEERRLIAKSVLDLGHIPAAMEYFPAIDDEQLKYIKRIIDQCDYYVLVIAGKYGSQDEKGVSYTEREYDYAKSKGKFVLGFPFHDITKLPRDATEDDTLIAAKLKKFREKVMKGRLVRLWEDDRDLDNKVTKALSVAFNEFPQGGWVRTPENSSENLLSEINNLRKENDKLKSLISNANDEIKPFFDDLAELGDVHKITINACYGNGEVFKTFEVSLYWSFIFVILAASIKGNSQPHLVRNSFVTELANSEDIIRGEGGIYVKFKIPDLDYSIIIAHFVAMKLIEEQKMLLYRLTPHGETVYLQHMAVRKKA